jgi:hypothetical protein
LLTWWLSTGVDLGVDSGLSAQFEYY